MGAQSAANSWHFYLQCDSAWEAMYRDCAAAETSIEYEQYILENDALGQRFMKLFIKKAAAGLKVLIICDTFGSGLMRDSPLVAQLKEHGGRIYFYNPITFLDMLFPWRSFPRTHTKTLLIDSKIAYAGGVCIAERMKGWRDTQMRMTGPVIAQINKSFNDLEARLLHKKKKRPPANVKASTFRYILNRPNLSRFSVYREVAQAIKNAERCIYITSAFFIPNLRFYILLKHAHKRGVDVKIIVPERSDVRLADIICLSYYPRLRRCGARLYHYQKSVLHSKTAVIDDNWATVGSMNFDIISFFHNREANIIITQPEAVAQMHQHFINDLEDCIEMTPARWANVPRWKKIIGYMGRAAKIMFKQ